MATSKLNDIITRAVANVVDEIRAAVRAELLADLASGVAKGSPKVARGANMAAIGMGKGQKRAPEALFALKKQLHQYIAKNPGQRIEQIAVGMGVTTRELNLPVKKLISEKRLTTKGQKRATTYTAK